MKRKKKAKLNNLISKYAPDSGADVTRSQQNPNFVAKHTPRTGTGTHKDKTGENAPRSRQKNSWKKQVNKELNL